MKIYLFDKKTKEFTREAKAQPSPLEPGKYLYPTYSTTTEPPKAEDGYVQCWDGKSWVKTEDHRQKRDKGGVIIEGVGTPYWLPSDTWETRARYMTVPGALPSDALLERPDKPFDLLKEDKLNELKGDFSMACNSASVDSAVGFTINANGDAYRNIDGLLLTIGDDETVLFCDYENAFHEVDKSQLEVMKKEVAVHGQDLYQTKWKYRSLIEAATTKAELDAIVITF